MAPSKEAINTAKLSFTVAQKVCTARDFEQLACAYLATEDLYAFDKDKAAREFSNAKPDSFKRQIWVIGKKIKDAMDKEEKGEEVGGGVGEVEEKAKGRKRKVEGDEAGPKKKGRGGKAKKGSDDGEVPEEEVKVKSEGEGEGDEDLV